jgi:hypothetical protein
MVRFVGFEGPLGGGHLLRRKEKDGSKDGKEFKAQGSRYSERSS